MQRATCTQATAASLQRSATPESKGAIRCLLCRQLLVSHPARHPNRCIRHATNCLPMQVLQTTLPTECQKQPHGGTTLTCSLGAAPFEPIGRPHMVETLKGVTPAQVVQGPRGSPKRHAATDTATQTSSRARPDLMQLHRLGGFEFLSPVALTAWRSAQQPFKSRYSSQAKLIALHCIRCPACFLRVPGGWTALRTSVCLGRA